MYIIQCFYIHIICMSVCVVRTLLAICNVWSFSVLIDKIENQQLSLCYEGITIESHVSQMQKLKAKKDAKHYVITLEEIRHICSKFIIFVVLSVFLFLFL